MKQFKKLKEYILQDESYYKFLMDIKIVDKTLTPIDFRTQINADKANNSFLFPTNKSHLISSVAQNIMFYVFDNLKKKQAEIKALPYKDRSKLSQMIMEEHHSNLLHSFVNFLNEGQKVVSIKNKELLEQFENTSLKNLKFQDFKVFLDAFYLSVERKFGNTYVDGFFVQNEKDCFELTILINREQKANELLKACLYKEHNVEKAIEVAIAELAKDCEKKLESISDAKFKKDLALKMEKEDKDDSEILNYTFKFLINVLMFFNSQKNKDNPNFEIKEENRIIKEFTKKDKFLSAKMSNANYYYYLSSNTANNKAFKLSEKERKINKMFVVSGHYRQQPIGSRENVEYKTIWIEPFLKGEGILENKVKNIVI